MKKRRMTLEEYKKHLETHAITVTVPLDGRPYEPKELEIDLDIIPECICEQIGSRFYELFMDFMKQPGAREMLEAQIGKMEASKARLAENKVQTRKDGT